MVDICHGFALRANVWNTEKEEAVAKAIRQQNMPILEDYNIKRKYFPHLHSE
jgi:hypothetical protein